MQIIYEFWAIINYSISFLFLFSEGLKEKNIKIIRRPDIILLFMIFKVKYKRY